MSVEDEVLDKIEGTVFEKYSSDIAELPDEYRELVAKIINLSLDYDETSVKEDVLRELMQLCDQLMSDYQDEHHELPEEFEQLNDLLWSWFQSPPEDASELQDSIEEKLSPVFPGAGDSAAEEPEGESPQCQAETSSGERCQNRASYPEDDPKYCGVHKDKLDEKKDEEAAEEEMEAESSEQERVEVPAGEGEVLKTSLDVDPTVAADFLMEANEQLETLDNLLVEVEENPDENSLNELFRCMHSLKGGFGFCGLETCTELTHAAEDLLGIWRDDIPDHIPASWMDLMFATLDSVRAILVAMEEAVDEEKRELEIPLSREFIAMLKEDLHKACDGEEDIDNFPSLEKQKEEGGEREEVGEETINIELSKIDAIVDLVGELVISHSGLSDQLEGHIDYELENMLNQQDKILDQLQRRSMGLRMLPMKKEFNKLPRVARDLARELDKDIDLNISGADTEIDKSVLDSLHDPLVHLLRNAIDHGVESPEERKKAGKSPTGQVYIRAYHESGNVYIEVEDDGGGLPRDAIEAKAIEQGLIDEEHNLSPAEIDRLIFNPGFSTTEEVSDVSGRGVGMDVVASHIDDLRGAIDIDSTPGEGTKFIVELPLTVAIIDGLISKIGEEKMIFPVNQVVESVNPQPEDIKHMQDKGRMLRYRDTVIPLIDPGEVLENAEPDESVDKRTIFVIVRSNAGRYAVRVDRLFSHEQVVIKKLGKGEVEDAEVISGGAILGDGSVGLIVDVPALVRTYRQQKGKTNQQPVNQ